MPIGYVTQVTLVHIFNLQVCCTDLVITKHNLFLFRHLAYFQTTGIYAMISDIL